MTDADLDTLAAALGHAIGFPMAMIPDGIVRSHPSSVSATARSPRGALVEVVAHILDSEPQPGTPSTWALVFFFVHRVRVAPPGQAFLTLSLAPDGQSWQVEGWEDDVHDEWKGLSTLDD